MPDDGRIPTHGPGAAAGPAVLRPEAPSRSFLFLQGPHGPFFFQLARMLHKGRAQIAKVGFNQGDAAFWADRASYIPYTGRSEDWPRACAELFDRRGVTDLVLYGDMRPIHAQAIGLARARGITVHCFEEGYLRPWWVTYERGGVNGNSPLMQMSIADMAAALDGRLADPPQPPARWGDMREHSFYGALYHFHVLFRNGGYPHWRTHREIPVAREAWLNFRRFLATPRHAVQRAAATWRIRRSGHVYHLVLLQLEHDSSFRHHSPFASMTDFVAEVVDGFAAGAPAHHHLVFKAHPLEDDRAPLRRTILREARSRGLEGRVHFVRGGKLARLLDTARSVVTVNSTAAQQALWRGLPVKAFGACVYDKPELVSRQPLANFFADPAPPDLQAYRIYRSYLLATSQVPGGFYSAAGRRRLVRAVADMVLDERDPYQALGHDRTAPAPALRVVRG